jgi:hypothetical protein
VIEPQSGPLLEDDDSKILPILVQKTLSGTQFLPSLMALRSSVCLVRWGKIEEAVAEVAGGDEGK